MSNDRTAFVFLNPQPYGTPVDFEISLHDLGLVNSEKYNFYEMFTGNLTGQYNVKDTLKGQVNPSGSVYGVWAEPVNKKEKPKAVSFI